MKLEAIIPGDRTADAGEAAVNAAIIIAAGTPVAVLTESVHAAAIAGCVATIVVNAAYWRYRRLRGDVLIEEHGTPYDRQ